MPGWWAHLWLIIQVTGIIVKLHLGCGIRRVGMDDFIHVDIRPEVHPDVMADITSLDGRFPSQEQT